MDIISARRKGFGYKHKIDYLQDVYASGSRPVLAIFNKRPTTPMYIRNTVRQYAKSLAGCKPIFGIENVSFVDDIEPSIIASLPVDIYGIVWNYHNMYASGCRAAGGLSNRGRELLQALWSNGKIVDVAHANKASFYDCIDAFDDYCNSGDCNNDYNCGIELSHSHGNSHRYSPRIVCTHTCMDSVNSHVRNLDIAQVGAIVDRGGLVGLTLVKEFLGGDTVEIITKHIDWFCGNFGSDNLCIGTDFFGTKHIAGFETYDKLDRLRDGLLMHGYKAQDIDNIFYNNLSRLLD